MMNRLLKRRFPVLTQSAWGGGAAAVVTYTIAGIVYDYDGTTPVASATITLGAYSTTSAANGTYTVSGVPAGTSGSMTCVKTGRTFTAIVVASMSGNLTAQNYTAVILLKDTFTDTDTTAIASHTIAPTNTPSTSWTAQVGIWTISGNKALAPPAANAHATCNPGVADCTITCKAQTSATNGNMAYDVGLVVRWGATTDYFLVGINSQGDLFRISERVSDNPVSRATASVTIDAGTEYTIVVTLSGTSISATLDGANQISYASATANQTATIHGIKGRNASDTLDDFQVVG